MNNYKLHRASMAQKKYCETIGAPWFAPDRQCYKCHLDIYADVEAPDGSISHGYTEEYAKTHLITGCPHCHFSFVE